jgi:DNA-binding response OmpR family regulator
LILELEGFATICHGRPADVPTDRQRPLVAAILDLSIEDDGWPELAATLGRDGIPFLIVGDGDEDGLQRQVTETGATAFVRKPFDPKVLVEALGRMLPEGSPAQR